MRNFSSKILLVLAGIWLASSCTKEDPCKPAPTANAGVDQVIVGSETTLSANSTTTGTAGTWTIVSGDGGTLTDPLDPETTFTGIKEINYVLKWTIKGCPDSEDEVTISFICDPTQEADAGIDQTIQGTSTTLSANGSGTWSIISGVGGVIEQTTNPASTFTGTLGTTYDLRWSVECPDSQDMVSISFVCDPDLAADAGVDQSIEGTSTSLAANGVGLWSIISGAGGVIEEETNHASTFTGIAGTTYELRWTVACPESHDDVQIVFVNPNPHFLTIDHTSVIAGSIITITGGNFSANHQCLGNVNFVKDENPSMGLDVFGRILSRTETEIKAVIVGVNGGATGQYSLRYASRSITNLVTYYPSDLKVNVVAATINQFYVSSTLTTSNAIRGGALGFGMKNGNSDVNNYAISMVQYDCVTGQSTEYPISNFTITPNGFGGGTMDKVEFVVPVDLAPGTYSIKVSYFNGIPLVPGYSVLLSVN